MQARADFRPLCGSIRATSCNRTPALADRGWRAAEEAQMSDIKVLVSDDLSKAAVEIMSGAGLKVDVKTGLPPAELGEIIGQYHGLAVRSATKVTPEILSKAANLKIVGPRRRGRGQHRRQGRHREEGPGHQHPVGQRHRRRRAGHRLHVRPGPQDPPGHRQHEEGRVGEEEVLPASRSPARRWAWSASATSAARWPSAGWGCA